MEEEAIYPSAVPLAEGKSEEAPIPQPAHSPVAPIPQLVVGHELAASHALEAQEQKNEAAHFA
jgi:hypothetical protein